MTDSDAEPSTVKIVDPMSADYDAAFAAFLAHTDQKERAHEKLVHIAARLARRRTLIDAGAGTGQTTALLARHFAHTIAIEPNEHLRRKLARTCPDATILGEDIATALPDRLADLVLSAHVFYYLPPASWLTALQRLASWTAAGGSVVVILQNPDTDCMRLLRHFTGRRFDLRALGRTFAGADHDWEMSVSTEPAVIDAPDLDTAVIIAQFLLNLVPLPDPPTVDDVATYLRDRFRVPGGYRFSCDQDFLELRSPGPS
ncbi:class I SAM-dependent methyltransferase [Nonomuraea jiangxiensis]|uniref:Methyltransferase domain-containing protein n=1 Tax=Nonomuraea jiangxiensis TaxID=633440 RepID=A0A1G9IT44_9ACTN|nr:class I SAM-dependent methyltransferase [Nonomuraea jiangxiensis]SDL28478.1 Methyltransferase domain-containing protein [Nonomuraea jiangxiensis]